MLLDELIVKLLEVKQRWPDDGVKEIFFNEDRMNGDLDRRSLRVVSASDTGIDIY